MGVIKNSNNGGNIKGERTGGRNRRGKDIIIGRARVVKRNIYLMKYK
jgi:hypothetical protein